MAKTQIQKKEKDQLKMIFDALDEEKDGEIELKEFVIQLNEKFDIFVTVNEMEQIMKQIDLDYDGKIQFTEFLAAACNKVALFSPENIEETFHFIDADNDGEITKEDLIIFLGGDDENECLVGNILANADENNDGGLELHEFSAIMMQVLETTKRNR